MDAGEDGAIGAGAVVQGEVEELLGLGHGHAVLDLDRAEIALGKGVEVHEVLEQRLDDDLGVVERGLGGRDERARGAGGLGVLSGLRGGGTALGALLGLHVREQQDVADGGGVGEQHDHAVDADADATRGGHAVLERAHVVLVVLHGLVVATGLLGHLRSEALGLVDRVVQLGERVGVLVAGDHEFKAVREARVLLVALGERRDLDRVIAHERGVHNGVLAQLVVDLGDELAGGPLGLGLDASLGARGEQLLDGRVERDLAAEHVGDDLGHGAAGPRREEVDLLALVLDSALEAHGGRGGLDDALGELLHALEVRIGAVSLHGGELGVVGEVHALVAEDAADLEHALIAAHQQALEVQLGGDAQVVLLVERIEVRDERLGRGAALDGLQDGGLDLHVAVVLHVAAEGGDDGGALAERLAHVLVHNEVDIALAVAGLLVGEAVELLGQRTDGLGEQLELARGNGELAALGAGDHAGGLDDVAQVELLERGPRLLLHVVHAAEELDVGGGVAQDQEHDLALTALGDHAAAHGDGLARGLLVGQALVAHEQVGGVIGYARVLRIGVLAGLVERGAVDKTTGALVVQGVGGLGDLEVLGHLCDSSRNAGPWGPAVHRCGDRPTSAPPHVPNENRPLAP